MTTCQTSAYSLKCPAARIDTQWSSHSGHIHLLAPARGVIVVGVRPEAEGRECGTSFLKREHVGIILRSHAKAEQVGAEAAGVRFPSFQLSDDSV